MTKITKGYVCVVTILIKDEDKLTISHAFQYPTGIDDPKDLILYGKLRCKDKGITDVDFELWKGPKYGDRLGFDTTKQIGESFAEIWHYPWHDEIYVTELYKASEN